MSAIAQESPAHRSSTTEYRVSYRRATWVSTQRRLFQSAPPAQRLVARLNKPGRYAPIMFIAIEKRHVGPWETVEIYR